MKKPKGIKSKKVKGFFKTIKVLLYKDHPILVRMVGDIRFEYMLMHNNQFYSSFIVIRPRKGEKCLSDEDIQSAANIVYAGGEATVDALLGIELNKEDKEKVELFEKHRKAIEGKG